MKNNKGTQLVSIASSDIDIQKIIQDIRRGIRNKKLSYIKDLKKDIPEHIDTTENSEYLLDGWYENESIAGTRAKWTKKSFSFYYNLRKSNKICLEIIAGPPKLNKKSLQIVFFINKQKIDSCFINETQTVVFGVPSKFKEKPLIYNFKLSYDWEPAQDSRYYPRRQGVAIKSISNRNLSLSSVIYHEIFDEFRKEASFELERINYHLNPTNLLPDNTKLKFFKKLILRILRVYTSVQIGFNTYTFSFLRKLFNLLIATNGHIEEIEVQMRQKFSTLTETEIINVNKKDEAKKNIFFHKFEDRFYTFQQDKFRGSYKEIIKKQVIYLPYLNKIKRLNDDAYIIDLGFGRGEFLQILNGNGFKNVIGIDINKSYVEEALKNGYRVYLKDAIDFLFTFDKKICSISAFHLLEHLSFSEIFDLLYLAYHKLSVGGMVIVETPNIENLLVSSYFFHYDHTHKTKLSPLFLRSVFEFIGFKEIEILYLSPIKEKIKDDIEKFIYGPQEYTIIAYK